MSNELSKISVFMGKNKDYKTVYVKEATFYLKKLQQGSKGEYVFPSQKNPKMPISDVTAYNYIRELGKHINKKIFPYVVRHSRSQELYEMVDKGKLSENVAMKTLGHKKSMRDIYHDLKDSTIREAIENSVYKFEEMPEAQKSEFEEFKKITKETIKLILTKLEEQSKLLNIVRPELMKAVKGKKIMIKDAEILKILK